VYEETIYNTVEQIITNEGRRFTQGHRKERNKMYIIVRESKHKFTAVRGVSMSIGLTQTDIVTYGRRGGQIKGQTGRERGRQTDRQRRDGRTDGWIDRQRAGKKYRETDGQTGWTDGWLDGRMNRQAESEEDRDRQTETG
jgi:hypothetical protein